MAAVETSQRQSKYSIIFERLFYYITSLFAMVELLSTFTQVLYLSIYFFSLFILLLHYISGAQIVFFTVLQLFDNLSDFVDSD